MVFASLTQRRGAVALIVRAFIGVKRRERDKTGIAGCRRSSAGPVDDRGHAPHHHRDGLAADQAFRSRLVRGSDRRGDEFRALAGRQPRQARPTPRRSARWAGHAADVRGAGAENIAANLASAGIGQQRLVVGRPCSRTSRPATCSAPTRAAVPRADSSASSSSARWPLSRSGTSWCRRVKTRDVRAVDARLVGAVARV